MTEEGCPGACVPPTHHITHTHSWSRSHICPHLPTWFVKEQDMTKEGWPVAQPRFSRRPSARMMTPWPSGKMKRSHWGLMVCTGVCACVCVGGRGKHFSVVFGTKQAGQRKHA